MGHLPKPTPTFVVGGIKNAKQFKQEADEFVQRMKENISERPIKYMIKR